KPYFALKISAQCPNAADKCYSLLADTGFCTDYEVAPFMGSHGLYGYSVRGETKTEQQIAELHKKLQRIDIGTIEAIRALASICLEIHIDSRCEVDDRLKAECSRLGLTIYMFSRNRLEEAIDPVS
ncbi:MAG: hypothetical protein M3347_04025, partial [Armatimonadota bacterium]|nr:hypothetical protein [Armatimonadota bacterium]